MLFLLHWPLETLRRLKGWLLDLTLESLFWISSGILTWTAIIEHRHWKKQQRRPGISRNVISWWWSPRHKLQIRHLENASCREVMSIVVTLEYRDSATSCSES